jgi:hypothetical protein
MSVYVGIDVHRKRSQVAVVTEEGQVQLNKNVVNGSEPFLRLIGDLPSGTPVAFEAAFGWSWLADLLEEYGFDAHLVHPLRSGSAPSCATGSTRSPPITAMTGRPATGPGPAAAGWPNWTCPPHHGRSSPTAWRSSTAWRR